MDLVDGVEGGEDLVVVDEEVVVDVVVDVVVNAEDGEEDLLEDEVDLVVAVMQCLLSITFVR